MANLLIGITKVHSTYNVNPKFVIDFCFELNESEGISERNCTSGYKEADQHISCVFNSFYYEKRKYRHYQYLKNLITRTKSST